VIAFALGKRAGLAGPRLLREDRSEIGRDARQIRGTYRRHASAPGPAVAEQRARVVMAIETDLAKVSLTLVERRDPYKQFRKLKRSELEKLVRSFSWPSYWQAIGLPAPEELNVTEPRLNRGSFSRWIGARRQIRVTYLAAITHAESIPESLQRFAVLYSPRPEC